MEEVPGLSQDLPSSTTPRQGANLGAVTPRILAEEPSAGNLHARICEGPGWETAQGYSTADCNQR